MIHSETSTMYLRTRDYSACELHKTSSKATKMVIKEMNKGSSLPMHHASRTRRVDLDWLYDRINLDPMIQIKYVNTTQNLARYSLTRGSLTGDRWTQLTLLVTIMTRATFAHSKLSVSCAAVNPLFSSMSIRAGESFAASASAQQKPVHCTAMIARKLTTRMPTWTITQYFHQITNLEATLSVKNCVSKILKHSPQRRLEHQC